MKRITIYLLILLAVVITLSGCYEIMGFRFTDNPYDNKSDFQNIADKINGK